MDILLLGSGGRECAFAWKISQSPKCDQLFIAPGNAGTSAYGTNINIKATDFDQVKEFVLAHKIQMVIVGPEDPLVKGIHDYFLNDDQLKDIPVIGPQKEGAQLEGSKDFSKRFMQRHHIPTARYASFTKDQLNEGLNYLETHPLPVVLKADGLAAGKGVLICESLQEAKNELKEMLADAKFGDASSVVVIEEFLKGIELSVFVLTDGHSYKILPEAKDYKRIGEGDTGLNTGGMGSISPVPFADQSFMKKVEDRIIKPTIDGLKKENIPYKGFVFIGLMKVNGEPYVIEYNVRMGDPETESVLPRIKSDIMDLFEGVAKNNLSERTMEIDDRTAVTIMLVSGGYPGDYHKGMKIEGLGTEDLKTENSFLFHAGTEQKGNDVVTSGGRVIAVTTLANDIRSALNTSRKNAEHIQYEGKYFRKDIGFDLLSSWKIK
jgi:phosphoribosylamine---glycine ligase